MSWAPIVNRGEREDAKVWADCKTNARFATTNYGVTSDIEKEKSTYHIVRRRAQLDVRLLQIAAFLKLRFQTTALSNKKYAEQDEPPLLYAPDSGGVFLLTSKECDRQIVHCDFDWQQKGVPGDAPKNSSYYFLVSGENPTPIWFLTIPKNMPTILPKKDEN